MDDLYHRLITLIATTLVFATPITLGAMSGIACERSGVVNIAIEGMMLSAAFGGFWAAVTTHSLFLAVVVAVLVSMAMSALHAALSITFRVDQIISGTVINILGFGITGYLYGQWYASNAPLSPGTLPSLRIPGSTGRIQLIAILAIVLVAVMHVVLNYTPWGLRVRAVGEHPKAADTVGVNVRRVRYSAVLLGGVLAGLGGAAYVPGNVPAINPGDHDGRLRLHPPSRDDLWMATIRRLGRRALLRLCPRPPDPCSQNVDINLIGRDIKINSYLLSNCSLPRRPSSSLPASSATPPARRRRRPMTGAEC
ncbi:MAG: ABC transporter permease [Chloroflexia bacterium]